MAKKPTKNNHQGSEDYSASDITVMEGLEAVRKRPGMYIGTTGLEGVQHLIHEIVDNGVDEAMAGFATKIQVTLNYHVEKEYKKILKQDLNNIGNCGWFSDIISMRHENQFTRIFRT